MSFWIRLWVASAAGVIFLHLGAFFAVGEASRKERQAVLDVVGAGNFAIALAGLLAVDVIMPPLGLCYFANFLLADLRRRQHPAHPPQLPPSGRGSDRRGRQARSRAGSADR